jgi:hypothetical protein
LKNAMVAKRTERPKRPRKNAIGAVAFRLETGYLERLDAAAERLSRGRLGPSLTRTDALRIALDAGLPLLEKERRRRRR